MNPERVFYPSIVQLRAFAAVYRLGKVSAAAESLFITQSAVSASIRQLETGWGVRLFDRTTRSLKATPAAQDCIQVAERVLKDLESLSAEHRDKVALRRGTVSLVVTPTLGEILLPAAVQAFQREHPGIRLVIDDCAPDQFIPRLVSEQVDFGIGTPERGGVAEVDKQTLLKDHLAVVMPAGHPWAGRKSVPWSALRDQAVITVKPGYGIRPLIEVSAAQAGVHLDVVNEVTFLSTALWMCSCGMGLVVMPAAYVKASRDPGLLAKPLTHPKVTRDICLVTARGRSLSPAAHVFIDTLKNVLAQG